MIAVFIGLLLLCLRTDASKETSKNDGPTWTLLTTNRLVDLCTETECKASYWDDVIFEAKWTIEGSVGDPYVIFSDDDEVLFTDNKYYIELPVREGVGAHFKFVPGPCRCLYFVNNITLTSAPLTFHDHAYDEDGKYVGNLSLKFPYRDANDKHRTLVFPTKTVTVERLYEEDDPNRKRG